MARLPGPIARLRTAVREGLADLPRSALVLVACSGGPDSLALADTVAFCAPRDGLRAGLISIDHGLQEGSAARAADLAAWGRRAGFEPSEAVEVDTTGPGGPEAAARAARYAALDAAADRHGAAAILLGHTRDDQAETVLLALARGGGPRGIAAMRPVRGRYRRPMLEVPRSDTHAACAERGLDAWFDPHNEDPRYRRSALREAMAVLTQTLGDSLPANLARTARLVGADADLLDEQAAEAFDSCRDGAALKAEAVAALPLPIRVRVLRSWIFQLGVNGGDLNHRHLEAVDALVTAWHGQGPVWLPGGVAVHRRGSGLTAGHR